MSELLGGSRSVGRSVRSAISKGVPIIWRRVNEETCIFEKKHMRFLSVGVERVSIEGGVPLSHLRLEEAVEIPETALHPAVRWHLLETHEHEHLAELGPYLRSGVNDNKKKKNRNSSRATSSNDHG